MSRFTSGNITLNAQSFSVAHGLGSAPVFVRAVLVCTANDLGSGFVSGQETAWEAWFDSNFGIFGAIWADAVNLYAQAPETMIGTEAGWGVTGPGGVVTPTSFGNFRLKFYAET